MDSWTRKALEQLEDDAIAKAQEREAKGLALDGSEDHKGSKHYISSGEEIDTSVSLMFFIIIQYLVIRYNIDGYTIEIFIFIIYRMMTKKMPKRMISTERS